MDIKTQFDTETLSSDMAMDSGLLAADESLETAVVISLFTDRRAADDDVLPTGSKNKRGCWFDPILPDEGDQYGSRLWLLHREKQTEAVRRKAQEYAEEALAWLVEKEYATSVEVVASYPRRNVLGLEVIINLTTGGALKYAYDNALELS